jgi:hypothetical protein
MSSVLTALIDMGALAKDSIVTARQGIANRFGVVNYQSGDYVIKDIVNTAQGQLLSLRASDGMNELIVMAHDVLAIDGMSIERFAEIYNINADGSLRSMGRKRGRKPKIR